MASIKDALEESIQDTNAFSKFVLYSLPVFYTIMLLIGDSSSTYYAFINILTNILLFGFMIQCTYNVKTGASTILPSFNVFSVFWAGIKGTVALAPIVTISVFLSMALAKLIAIYIPEGAFLTVFTIIVSALCAALPVTAYLLYVKKFKISDSYNILNILKYCADVMIALFFMGIQLIIINAIILAPITYMIWLFFGIPSPAAIFVWSIAAVLNVSIAGHYLAQIDYEIIALSEQEQQEKNELGIK